MTLLISLFLLLGTFFIFVASLGVIRMPDLYTRIHAVTKAGSVGIASILLAVIFAIPEITVISRALGTILFIMITAPVAAHLLGKAAHDSGYKGWSNRAKNNVK